LDTRFEVSYGILSLALGGYLQYAAQWEITFTGLYQVFALDGVAYFVGIALIGLGLYFIIHAAVRGAMPPKMTP
jgi:hypothetical protein